MLCANDWTILEASKHKKKQIAVELAKEEKGNNRELLKPRTLDW